MVDEITLFLDDIKPVLLLGDDEVRSNRKLLSNFKISKVDLTDSYFIYRREEDLCKSNLGEILGYPPFCGKAFKENKVFSDPNSKEATSCFINYNGILFNCFDFKEEALEWCNNQYKEKMLKKYGKIEILYIKKHYIKEDDFWMLDKILEKELYEVKE